MLAQASAVTAVAVNVNRDYGFYPDWSSFWGTPVAPSVVPLGTRMGVNAVRTPRRTLPLTSGLASDVGRYERITLKGPTAHPTSRLRVSADGGCWSVMGWSTGGYCAAKLHLSEPSRFGAAASVEGYFNPEPDTNTGNLAQLLNQYPALAHQSSPTWLIENAPPPRVHLLVMSSDTDPQSYPQALESLRRETNVSGVQPHLVNNMGHNIGSYKAVLVPVLDWLAAVGDL